MKRAVTLARALGALVVGTIGIHCTDQTSDDAPDSGPQLTQPTPVIAMSDSEIAGVLVAANAAFIAEGNLVASRASSSDVKTYASKVVGSHTQQDARQHALFTQLAITPATSKTSDTLAQSQTDTVASLSALSGDAFDKAYVHAQVDLGTVYVVLLADSMIPSSKNEDLLGELEQTRITVGDELGDAQNLNVALNPYDAGPFDAGPSDALDANGGDAGDGASGDATDGASDAANASDAADAGD